MSTKQKIVVCGGGNAAHVFTTLAASKPDNEVHLVSLFRTEASDLAASLAKTDDKLLTAEVAQEKREVKALPASITNDPKNLANADIVILSLPAFAHNQYLKEIKKHVQPRQNKKTLIAVFPGASGLECEFQSIFGKNNPDFVLLSCITLPWACRILTFGQRVEILGTKNQIEVCLNLTPKGDEEKKSELENKQKYMDLISGILGPLPKVIDFGHIINMSLSAINAVIHPGAMYSRWKDYDGKEYDEKPLIYHGITKEDASTVMSLSDEVVKITGSIQKDTGVKLQLRHFFEWFISAYGKECKDTSSLYHAIRSNPAFKGLTHPMKKNENGKFVPDYSYRYLTEDIPCGLIVIRGLSLIVSKANRVDAPLMDKIIQWAQGKLNKEYLKYGNDGSIVAGKDIGLSRAPQRYGFKDIKELF